jgi:hypothetical protein
MRRAIVCPSCAARGRHKSIFIESIVYALYICRNCGQIIEPPPEASREYSRLPLEELKSVHFRIVLFGSSKKQSRELYSKRKKLKAQLNNLGHQAILGEELPTIAGLSLDQIEALHLKSFDYLILFESGPGPLAEMLQFVRKNKDKSLVLLPKRYLASYVGKGPITSMKRSNCLIVFFNDFMVEVCALIQICETMVRYWQAEKYLQERGALG